MTRKKEESKFRRRSKRKSVGVEIPKDCLKCAWKEDKTAIAKIKCNNKDAEVLQKNGVWVCYSFTTHIPNNKRKRKGR